MAYPMQLDRTNTSSARLSSARKAKALSKSIRNGKRRIVEEGTDPLQMLFEPALVGVGRVAPSGQWLSASAALCRMLGYDRTDLLRRTVKEVTYPDDWSKENVLLEKALNDHQDSYEIEKRYITRSGVPLWVKETSSLVRNSDGSCLSRICLIEVNEHKRMERLFRLVIESSTNAMVLSDQCGKAVLANPQIETMFGYRRSELLGKTLAILLPGFVCQMPPTPTFPNTPIYATENAWDSFGRRKDGTYFPAEIRLNAIETRRGTWTLSSITDLGGRKHAEVISTQSQTQLKASPIEIQ